jgi:hypothetical protein
MQSISDALKPLTDSLDAEAQQSQESSSRNPASTRMVEHLFAKFAAMYGVKFADHWEGADFVAVKATWAEALADLSRQEVVAGLRGLVVGGKPFPPTLPEFFALCRPRVEIPPVTDHRALDRMASRLGVSTGGCDSYYQLRQRISERLADSRSLPALPNLED